MTPRAAGLLLLGAIVGCRAEPAGGPEPAAGERCLACHDAARERPPDLHGLMVEGCAACHLGDPTATEAGAAHVGLEPEPGALDTAARTCGAEACHPDQLRRVRRSLMTTASGIVAVDRWAFGEIATPTSAETLDEVLAEPHPTPAQDHLRRLCGGCHLGARRDNRDDFVTGVGTGCSACHSRLRATPGGPHPAIDLDVPDARCFGCHSRSGRVSLSYQGLYETKGRQGPAPTREVPGPERPLAQHTPDVHHEAGIGCVDCHLATELMGDGERHAREADQVELSCETCHGPGPAVPWSQAADPEGEKLLALRGRTRTATSWTRRGRGGTAPWNLEGGPGGWILRDKAGPRRWTVPPTPADLDHQRPGHARLSCASCHAAWAPTCTTCHTDFEPEGAQWDFGTGALSPGRWVETSTAFAIAAPVLATRGDRVVPAIPGMIAELDARAAGGERRRVRLFAATDPHTTRREARRCVDCHRDPWSLGLGAGRLDLDADPPAFTPASPRPGAPGAPGADGWSALFPDRPAVGSHPEVRALDAEAQRRTLRVGYCLGCHSTDDALFADFAVGLRRFVAGGATKRCRGRNLDWLEASPGRTSTEVAP